MTRSDLADDPYDIIKSTSHYDGQSAKMSAQSENEPRPLSNRERVRRSRESRGSSRMNTSSQKEEQPASEKSSILAANAYSQAALEPEEPSVDY